MECDLYEFFKKQMNERKEHIQSELKEANDFRQVTLDRLFLTEFFKNNIGLNIRILIQTGVTVSSPSGLSPPRLK